LAKITLQNEILATIDRYRDTEPEARHKALAALARKQESRITELEQTAEKLRRDLVTTNFGWANFRLWHLRDSQERGYSPAEIALVMRGYAYYKKDMSLAQRGLLREVTMELNAAVTDAADAGIVLPHVFFSPAMSRVEFPDGLSPELAKKVAEFQEKKSRLKKELYDFVQAYDGAHFAFIRYSFKKLAEKQAPHFEELESLAEEIRRRVVQSIEIPRSAATSPLPLFLAMRVSDVMRDRVLAQREAVKKADAIISRRYDSQVRVSGAYRFGDQGMQMVVVPARGPKDLIPSDEKQILAKVRAELGQVAEEYGNRLVEIINEQETIRADAAQLLDVGSREQVDLALLRSSQHAARKESDQAYEDYRAAVFEPGMSPGQRRIVFDRAIERLKLPLPQGEVQVSSRARSW